MLIFHRMQNLVPLQESIPFAICCTTPRMLTKLNKIDTNSQILDESNFVPFLPPGYICPACNQRVFNSQNIFSVAQIHTNTQRKVIVTSFTAVQWYVSLCNGTIRCTFSPHRLVHNMLQGIIFLVSHRNLLCIFYMTAIQNIFCVAVFFYRSVQNFIWNIYPSAEIANQIWRGKLFLELITSCTIYDIVLLFTVWSSKSRMADFQYFAIPKCRMFWLNQTKHVLHNSYQY